MKSMMGLSLKTKWKRKKPKANKQCRKKIKKISDDTMKINVTDYHLSEDILLEIFTRLPLKLIFQLKLLSKQWYVLISSTNITTRRLHICTFFCQIRSVYRPLISYQPKPIPVVFFLNTDYSISDQEYIYDGFSLSFLGEATQKPISVLGYSNGLLLCRYSLWKGQYYYIICNPLTRKWSRLLSGTDNDHYDSHVFVCESSSSTLNTNPTGFKVVIIPQIAIPTKTFSLKIFASGTRYWKYHKVLCSDEITMRYENPKKVVSDQHGRLYWIVEPNKMISYDLKNNVGCEYGECMLIDLPEIEEGDDHGAVRSCISESEGFIFYIRIESRQMIVSVWLLEEEKEESNEQWSWKVVHKIKVHEMLEGYEWNNTRIMNVKPLGVSPMDRNIVFMQIDECILQYNLLVNRSQLLSLSSISSYQFGVLPFLATAKATPIPVIRRA